MSQKIAKETLEANLRGVLATLTPEEVNEDRLKFAQTLIDEADDDMRTLGLDLDVLKIQNVTDEVDYLDSVGRRRTAQVIMEARVAEAERQTEAQEAEAGARRRAEIAQVNANLDIVEKTNDLRVRQAELDAWAIAKEREARGGRREGEGRRRAVPRNRADRAAEAPSRSRRDHPGPGREGSHGTAGQG